MFIFYNIKNQFYSDFKILILFLFIGLFLSLLLLFLNQILAPKNADEQKISAYECGFEPFEDARIKFNIHYYLIAILFIIFDAEIIFLFPWILSFSYYSIFIYPVVLFFLFILTLGFIVEWKKSLLKW